MENIVHCGSNSHQLSLMIGGIFIPFLQEEVKTLKVRAIRDFKDRTADLKLRKTGEILEVTEERAKKLAGLGLVIMEPEKKEEKKTVEKG